MSEAAGDCRYGRHDVEQVTVVLQVLGGGRVDAGRRAGSRRRRSSTARTRRPTCAGGPEHLLGVVAAPPPRRPSRSGRLKPAVPTAPAEGGASALARPSGPGMPGANESCSCSSRPRTWPPVNTRIQNCPPTGAHSNARAKSARVQCISSRIRRAESGHATPASGRKRTPVSLENSQRTRPR